MSGKAEHNEIQDALRSFGERLKALRSKEELSQPDLASLLNVKRQTVASWEQGVTSPDVKTLLLLKSTLRRDYATDVDLAELVGEKQATQGAALDVIVRLLQRIGEMGLQDIHPTRAEALTAFCQYLEKEQSSISIVSSSFLGVTRVAPPKVGEILRRKASTVKDFRILLTHPRVSNLRESQEARAPGSITQEIAESVKTLEEWGVKRSNIRFYDGAPTIFLIVTSDRMLANPYTYQAEAFKTVTFEVSATSRPGATQGGIYEQYLEHHFSRPWGNNSVPLDEVEKELGRSNAAPTTRKVKHESRHKEDSKI